jgi:hypothetical protein
MCAIRLFAQCFDQRREQLMHISDNPVIAIFKDGRFRVNVNGDDGLGILNADDKMESSAYSKCERDFWATNDSCLPNLALTFNVTLIYRRSSGANLAVHLLAQSA